MGLVLHFEISTERPPDVMARKWSDLSKEGMQDVADEWQQKILPLHFEPFAAAKYGYQPRKQSTVKRKRGLSRRGKVEKGGNVSLVHSGDLEKQMQRAGVVRVYPTRVTVIKPAGSYITDRPRGDRPNMMRELLTVLDSESRRLGQIQKAGTLAALERFRERRSVTI